MLTPRLEMIADSVSSATIADIGTDHAYIPIHLAMNNKIDKAIATDLKKGPLQIAEKNVKKYALTDKIELRIGSGLSPVEKDEVEAFIIAGMGGELIRDILKNDHKKINSSVLILQPMNSQNELRKWLSENNFSIIKEDITLEGFKVYNLIIASKGKPVFFENEFDFHLPHYLYSHKFFNELKEKKRREFTKIKAGLEKASEKNEKLIQKYSDFLLQLERI